MSSTPRVGIIIKYNNKYLSVYQSASNLWGFPKGRIQENETLIECGLRELREETNIVLTKDDLSEKNLIHIKRGKHRHYYYITELYYEPLCQIDNDEIIDYRWISLKEFMNVSNVSFFTDQVLRKLTLYNRSSPFNKKSPKCESLEVYTPEGIVYNSFINNKMIVKEEIVKEEMIVC